MIRKLISCLSFALLSTITIGQGIDNVSVRVMLNEFPGDISWELEDGDKNLITTSDFTGCNASTFCTNDFLISEKDCYRLSISDSNPSDAESPIEYEVLFNGKVVVSRFLTDSIQTHSFGCDPGKICESAFFHNDINGTVMWPPVEDFWVEFVPPQSGLYQLLNCDLSAERRFPQTRMWVYEKCLSEFSDGPEGALAFSKDYSFCPPSSGFNAIPLEGSQSYYIRLSLVDRVNWVDSIDLTIERFNDNPGCTDPNACNYYPFATSDYGSCFYENCGPDLEVDQLVFQESVFLDSIQQNDVCLIEEGCLTGPGKRYIVRFSTLIKNIGNADYIIGSPEDNDGGFSNDNCHQHYHQLGYAEYILFAGNGNPEPIGFKNGFCVQDSNCPNGQQRYFCNFMGITAGCEDLYSSDIPCQWVDITNVDEGEYTLVVRINWNRLPDLRGFKELDYDNNWAQVCIFIDKSGPSPRIEILNKDCGMYRDCAGFAFGNAIIDCNNVCGGTSHYADLNGDGELDANDVNEYLKNLASSGIPAEPCFDLNDDGLISVYDIVLANDCLRNADFGTPEHNHCLFPAGQYQELDTVRFTVTDINTTNRLITLAYSSPQSSLKAIQLSFEGIEISGLDQMKSNGIVDQNNKNIFLFDEIELLARTLEDEDFIQLSYSSIDMESFCLSSSEVVNVRNQVVFSFNGSPNDCSFLTSTYETDNSIQFETSPNPAHDKLLIKSGLNVLTGVDLIRLDGALIDRWSFPRSNAVELDLPPVASGLYFVCATTDEAQKACQKILLQ